MVKTKPTKKPARVVYQPTQAQRSAFEEAARLGRYRNVNQWAAAKLIDCLAK